MFKSMLKKEQFWLIVVGAVLAILNDVLGFGVNSEAVWTVVGLLLGWLIKEGIVEASVKAAAIKAEGYVGAVKQLKAD
jgi:hypothetical protein